MPTGRLVVGRDAPAQGKQSGFINFSGGQSGQSDLELSETAKAQSLNP